MSALLNRAAALTLALAAATPSRAVLPQVALSPAFATESANYSLPGNVLPSYGFHFGEGTATASYSVPVLPPTNPASFTLPTIGASATVTAAGVPYISLTAANPTNPAGYASAHGELSYQYLASFAVGANSNLSIGDAYNDVVTIHAVSHLHSEGLATQASITASAIGSFVQAMQGQFYSVQRGDASDTVYDSDRVYDFTAPGQYVGNVTVNGQDYADFIGTIRLYANLLGITTTQQHISNGITPPGLPAGVPYSVTTAVYPGAAGSVTLDPLIGANAVFSHANGLTGGTIALSQGVGNASAPSGTPEPAAWALMIAGFGLTGMALRRRVAAAA